MKVFHAPAGVLVLVAGMLCCGSSAWGQEDAVMWDPPVLLQTKCAAVQRRECLCGSVFEQPLSFDDVAFMAQIYVDEGATWINSRERWLDQDLATELLDRLREGCRLPDGGRSARQPAESALRQTSLE